MIPFLLAGLVALVAIYMTYPRFKRKRLSAARFFRDLPPPKKGQSRLRVAKIELTLPFYLQLLILLSLLSALYLMEKKFSGDDTKGLGVWIVVDTSASMSTIQDEMPRIEAARKEVEKALHNAQKSSEGKELCFRLSFVDLEQRDLVVKGDALAVKQALAQLTPRSLGTDLGIVRLLIDSMANRQESQPDEHCRVSHMLIITDIPAPNWVSRNRETEVVWRDIAKPVDNVGFKSIRGARNSLTGLVSEVQLELKAYGKAPTDARVMVQAPNGGRILDQAVGWQKRGLWQSSFKPIEPGEYILSVYPGGAYKYDDEAVITIGGGREIRVDWQLKDRSLFRQMGWTQDQTNPQLRVTDKTTRLDNVPTLMVGPGYGAIRKKPVEIRDFMETSPLLKDINLDAVETIGLRGILIPQGLHPVLRGITGKTWLAQSVNPARAVVPGLPTGIDDITGRFSATVFFNAVRMLLKKRDLPPLYTLTTPLKTKPAANRLVLHKDEGNTNRKNRSSGKLDHLKPVSGKGRAKPLWPLLIMVAVLLFLLERALTTYGKT